MSNNEDYIREKAHLELESAYAEMAKDKNREKEALAWAEGTIRETEQLYAQD